MAATRQQPFLLDVGRLADELAVRAHRPDLHRLCGSGSEFLRERALSDSATFAESQARQRHSLPSARARRYRPDRLPLAAVRLSVHDARPDCGLGGGAEQLTGAFDFQDPKILLSLLDVGGLPADGVHALDCGLARPAARLSWRAWLLPPPSWPGRRTISARFTGSSPS